MLGAVLTQGAIRLNNILLAKGPILPANPTPAQQAEFDAARALVPKVASWFKDDNVVSTIGKEVVGINAPKAVNVRRFGEFLDAMVSELGNTIGYFGGGYALSAIMNKLMPRDVGDFHEQAERLDGLATVLKNKLPLSHVGGETAVKTFYAGKSVAFMAILGSFIWAMPFFRNVITATKLGTTKFTEIISGNSLLAKETPEEFKQNKRRYLHTGLAVLGTGLLVGLLGFGAASRQAAKLASKAVRFEKVAEPAWLKALDWKESWFTKSSFMFKDGKFSNLNGAHAFWFWGLPAYAGWFHASREKNERTEIVFKAVNFFVMFFGVNKALKLLLRRSPFYSQELLRAFKEHNQTNPTKPLEWGKEAFKILGEQLKVAPEIITHWSNNHDAHNTLSYFGSTAALFISNWLANDLSQWATGLRMAPKRQALGEETLSRLQSSDSTSTSVRRSFNEFTQITSL